MVPYASLMIPPHGRACRPCLADKYALVALVLDLARTDLDRHWIPRGDGPFSTALEYHADAMLGFLPGDVPALDEDTASETSSWPTMQLSKGDLPQPDGPNRTMGPSSATSRLSVCNTDTAPKLSTEPGSKLWSRLLPSRSSFHRAGGDAAHEHFC